MYGIQFGTLSILIPAEDLPVSQTMFMWTHGLPCHGDARAVDQAANLPSDCQIEVCSFRQKEVLHDVSLFS